MWDFCAQEAGQRAAQDLGVLGFWGALHTTVLMGAQQSSSFLLS